MTALELGEFELEGHAKHTDDDTAPTVVEYVFTPQSVHATLPLLVLYLPATHPEQTPPSGPVNPALQVQALMDILELGELELAGHNVHAALPLVVLYLLATHPEHANPSGPVNPGLQIQEPIDALPLGEFVFEGHARHVDAVFAPTVVEYVFTPQSVHAAFPLLVLYFPAPHDVQLPPLGPVNPALQIQEPINALPLGEFEFEGQFWHVDAVFEPTVPEYLPDPQSVHAALPLVSLYFPATHDVHEPAGPVVPAAQAVEIH